LDPDVEVDLTPLTDRSPAAIALSVQGDREYRQARFKEALAFYERAVAEDSSHAFAATKGAQAASWSTDFDAGERLIDLALRNRSLLPEKYASFAEGFRWYFRGDEQGARSAFQRALDIDPDWAEASVAMAEVFYHLLPSDAVNPDSLAEFWLLRAWESDTTFAPPLYHLSEIALRRGDTAAAARFIDQWRKFRPDTLFLDQVAYSLRCVRHGREGFDWMPLVGDHGRSVVQAGMALAAGGAQPRCARGAFLAAWSAELPVAYRYTALRGLFGLELAQGRYGAADSLVGIALGEGQSYSAARLLYVYGALVGAPFQKQAAEAEAMLRSAWGDIYAGPVTEWRWLMGAWLARTGEGERLARLVEDMGRVARDTDDREGRLLSLALETHLAVLQGDTVAALSLLQNLEPDGPRDRLSFHEPESLGLERLLLAELQLARGDPQAAYRTAALLDHSAPLVYPLFLPRSLTLRLEAAEQAGRADWIASARSRLETLGWTEEKSVPPIFN
jgi:tetratricopeptide (TPR) repeat protein